MEVEEKTNPFFGITDLMDAARNGHVEVVKALIDARADIHKADNDGRTALMLAHEYGHVEVVDLLRARGAE